MKVAVLSVSDQDGHCLRQFRELRQVDGVGIGRSEAEECFASEIVERGWTPVNRRHAFGSMISRFRRYPSVGLAAPRR
jgi:hypothetical protein